MAISIRKINEVQKVVLTKTKKSSEGGKGGVNQPIPKDVRIESLGEDEGGDEEKDKKDGQEKEGDGQKKEEVGEKGEKGQKGQKGEGEGEEDGQGQGQGSGSSESGTKKDIESIQKQAEELLNKIRSVDEKHQQCGSIEKRINKQNKEGIDKDTFNEQEKFTRERIKAIMDEEAASGKEHPMRNTGGYNRGEGEGSGGPRGEVIVIPARKPDFLRKMKQFAEKEYEKQYYKKGTDWLYTQSYDNVIFKDRPKVALPKKSVYIIVDVSGSMDDRVDSSGQSILEYVIGYLPTIAADFVGEVWWMSSGILRWSDGLDKGKEAISPLSYFKGKSGMEMTKFYKRVQNAQGSGGGTTFNKELHSIQIEREKQGHNAPILALTDGFIEHDVIIKYEWPVGSKKIITGKLPPNTYMMCFENGVEFLKDKYGEDQREGYLSYIKNIQYYNFSKENRFKHK